MRWQSITICILSLLWLPAAWVLPYEPRWSYELAILPYFPLSVALPIAIAKSAAVVLPFAIVYFYVRMDHKFSEEPMTFLRGMAFTVMALAFFFAILFFCVAPAITSALVA